MAARLALTILLLASAFPGCIDGDEADPSPPDEDTLETGATDEPAPDADAPPKVESEPAPAEDPEVAAETPSPEPIVVPFVGDGTMGTAVGACPVVTCTGVFLEEGTAVFPLEIVGQPLRIALTMTWEASDPTNEMLAVGYAIECGEECVDYQWGYGPSPLVFDEAPELDASATSVVLAAAKFCQFVGPVPVALCEQHPQDVHIEGSVTWMPAAPEA